MSSETVSDARLTYMLDRQNAGFTSLTSAEFISILTELQSLRSKPVASGAVKPLEWEQVGRRGKRVYRAETAFADYQVDCYEDSDGPGWEAFYGDVHELGCFATEQEAKSSAEADYRNRILSALTYSVEEPVAWRYREVQSEHSYWNYTDDPTTTREAVTEEMVERARLVIGPRISRKNMRAALEAAMKEA